MIHCSTFCSWQVLFSSLYNSAWNLGFVRLSEKSCGVFTNPILLICRALYAFPAAYISNMTRLTLVRLTLNIISNRIFQSVDMCTGIGASKNSCCFRIERVSSNRPANATTSADSTERYDSS